MKRPSLAESMKSVQTAPMASPARSEKPVKAAAERPARYYAATREGLKRITLPATEEKHRRLKRLSADSGRSIEALMNEALDDLFKKLG